MSNSIPVIDLFAGPGGLGEGFSSYGIGKKEGRFRIAVSVEKDPFAHKTLTLRAFVRQFPQKKLPDAYYQYLNNQITRETLFELFPEEAKHAKEEAQLRTLGKDPEIAQIIKERLKGHDKWVLIGGPPCQAYSLVGRSRMLGLVQEEGESAREFAKRKKTNEARFDGDHRHTLYKEYLKIIADHSPPIFVMENVKGILSSKLKGNFIFPQILEDLKDPAKALGKKGAGSKYRIKSLVEQESELFETDSKSLNFLIKSEEYGIPQARHRVILVGIREDHAHQKFQPLKKKAGPSLRETIEDLPPLTPGLSRSRSGAPYEALASILDHPKWPSFANDPIHSPVALRMVKELKKARKRETRGGTVVTKKSLSQDPWYHDDKLLGTGNHETRSHIKEDLWRYFFCSCFALVHGRSPLMKNFPTFLYPKHRNVAEAVSGKKFGDRFRVQCWNRPATTVTSHISKDGHYFIHPDPRQYRSLTVREAARLQTFPDNYRFEGPRTQQFHQVGNAVPPKLAVQIAEKVYRILR